MYVRATRSCTYGVLPSMQTTGYPLSERPLVLNTLPVKCIVYG